MLMFSSGIVLIFMIIIIMTLLEVRFFGAGFGHRYVAKKSTEKIFMFSIGIVTISIITIITTLLEVRFLGAGFGLILVIFRGFWGFFFVFLSGCGGGQNSVSSRRNAYFRIFALQIQVAKNLTEKRTSPC